LCCWFQTRLVMSTLWLVVSVIYIIVYSCLRGYSLNRRVYALFKVWLMCVFQFKRVSKFKPRYLTGVSLGVQVIGVLFQLLYQFVSSFIQVCGCVISFLKDPKPRHIMNVVCRLWICSILVGPLAVYIKESPETLSFGETTNEKNPFSHLIYNNVSYGPHWMSNFLLTGFLKNHSISYKAITDFCLTIWREFSY
jgi:hypothetical protein